MIYLDKDGKENEYKSDKILLTNNLGGYYYFSLDNFSKYQGFTFRDNGCLFKTIDRIIVPHKKFNNLKYNGSEIKLCFEEGNQKIILVKEKDAIIYENSLDEESYFIFDCRDVYDASNWGRYYQLTKEEGVILLKYSKINDEKESPRKEYSIYTAIRCENIDYEFIGKWTNVKYEFDEQRNDDPVRSIYDAFSLKTKQAVIASSVDKDEAIKTAKEIYENIEKYKEKSTNRFNISLKNNIINKDIIDAYYLSKCALESFKVKDKNFNGIYAGLPWFFQFWTRDSAMSLKSLYSIDKKFAKDLLLFYMDNIREDGLIPNIFPNLGIDSIDGTGIVFNRIYANLEMFSDDEIEIIKEKLSKSIKDLIKNHTENELIMNKEFETWMDTTNRDGVRIEIQSLFLSMISLLNKISNNTQDSKMAELSNELENRIKKKVKKAFFSEGQLNDGINDKTVRPNIFLAYYFYPDLLSKKEWENTFDNALKKLWLKWGGVSTIDKSDNQYVTKHTGSNNRSYHNGDSWYYINNVVAICLNRLNKKKYHEYIEKITKSSTHEILNLGIFGYHSELSSSQLQESNACLAQTWSSSTYIELIDEISK